MIEFICIGSIFILIWQQGHQAEKKNALEVVLISIGIAILAFITSMSITLTEVQKNAIRNNAAHWHIKTNPVTGDTTKEFKWGQIQVNELNEQQDNEPNEK